MSRPTVLGLLLLFSSCSVYGYEQKHCLLFGQKCVEHCPSKMHIYHTRCNGRTMSQKTCDSPQPFLLGYSCGWSRCDCNSDLVLDEQSNTCVELKFCPVKQTKERFTERKKGRRYHVSKRIRPEKNPFSDIEGDE